MSIDQFYSALRIERLVFDHPNKITISCTVVQTNQRVNLAFDGVTNFQAGEALADRGWSLLDVRLEDISSWQLENVNVRFADETPGGFVIEASSVRLGQRNPQ